MRHQPRTSDIEPVAGDEENIEAISDHIENWIGPVDGVFHELISDLVHIDIHLVKPTEDQPFWTLVTSGMSDRPMSVPEGAEEYAYAELAICLPDDWPLKEPELDEEENYWPLRLLKALARLPHEYDTWLGPGHTIPNGGDEDVPYADNTEFCCALILPPLSLLPEDFHELQLDDRVINFYTVWPMYAEEVQFKLSNSLDDLLDRFEKAGVTELIDLDRPNACPRKRWKLW